MNQGAKCCPSGTSFFKKLLQTFEKWSFSILKLFVKVTFGGGKG
jgi:hypothetical protein